MPKKNKKLKLINIFIPYFIIQNLNNSQIYTILVNFDLFYLFYFFI